ncbi:MAG: hypothetical protein GY722_24625 [bacterium]|nr:hypothetical protein [bacterium]
MADLGYETESVSRPTVGRSLLSRIRLGHVVMVLAALFALVFNLAVLRGNEATMEVLIAATDIRAGITLTPGHFATTEIPVDDLLSARFVSASDREVAVGQLATRSVAKGEPILGSDLLSIDNRGGLRAMSIPIDQARAVSGELSIGDSVDIVLVSDGVATYIATAIEVLSVPSADTNALGARSGYSPTVAVDATQALRIAAALDVGEVHIVRSTGAATPEIDRVSSGVDALEVNSG